MDQDISKLSHNICAHKHADPSAKIREVMLEAPKTSGFEKPKKEKKKTAAAAAEETPTKPAADDISEIKRKVKQYLTEPKFGDQFAEVKMPGPKASDAEWLSAWDQLQAILKSTYKQAMVRIMFQSGCKASETVMVSFLGMAQFEGLEKDVMSNIDDFEPELTEIAIELSNSWVPGPIPRLAMKVMNHLQKFSTQKSSQKSEAK